MSRSRESLGLALLRALPRQSSCQVVRLLTMTCRMSFWNWSSILRLRGVGHSARQFDRVGAALPSELSCEPFQRGGVGCHCRRGTTRIPEQGRPKAVKCLIDQFKCLTAMRFHQVNIAGFPAKSKHRPTSHGVGCRFRGVRQGRAHLAIIDLGRCFLQCSVMVQFNA